MAPKKTAGTKGKKGKKDSGEKETVTKATRASSGKVVSTLKAPPNADVEVEIQNPTSSSASKASAHANVTIENPSAASFPSSKELVSWSVYLFVLLHCYLHELLVF